MKFKIDTTIDTLKWSRGNGNNWKIFEKIGMDMPGNHAISDARKSAISDAVKLTSIETTAMSYMPVDIDVSPMDNSRTKKEGVGRTYKGCWDLYGFTVMFY